MPVLYCTKCKSHDYQDVKYGKSMRVFNFCGIDKFKARCTVCSDIKIINKKEDKIPEQQIN